ncbi:recombinase family protein [Alteribacter natronophilus]|uniref:recombinase family protein n=1 Tax=Alteribacter natronophilus TaxID=2583810 RepID=UPI001485F6EF|nr:recombinase family protein [Alteribacter natronophilus]
MSYRVGAFVRVSTDRVEQRASLQNQKEMVQDYIEEKGWNLEKLYTGPESGTKLNSSMKELLEDIENKNIDVLLVKDLYRLARNAELSHRVKNLADENGVHIVTLNDMVNTMEGKDEWYGLYAIFAQMEAENTSRNIKQILKKKMEDGKYLNSNPPYGYRIENQKLVVKDDYTPSVVRRIFHDYLDGKSPDGMAKELTLEGVPTPAQVNNRKNAGLRWHEKTVKGILTNRHYIGMLVQRQTTTISITTTKRKSMPEEEQIVFDDVHEPIVSKELFQQVKKMMEKRQRNRTAPTHHPFSNLLVCKDCGSGMNYKKNRKGYVCGRYAKYGVNCCKSHLIKEAVLMDIVKRDFMSGMSQMDKEVMKRDFYNKVSYYSKRNEREIENVEGRIEVLKRRKKNLVTMMADGELDRESCQESIKDADKEKAILEEDLKRLQNDQEQNKLDKANIEDNFAEYLFSGSTAIEIIHRVVDKVYIFEDGTQDIHYGFSEPELHNAS